MTDKQKFRILGLGLDTVLWKRLNQQTTRMFRYDEIDPEFQLVKYKWSNFKDKCLENLVEFNPDFIVTSSDLFKGVEELELFFQSYQPMDFIEYPGLVLIEQKPNRFIKDYLKVHPYSEIHFRQFPKLRITDPELIACHSPQNSLYEIHPLPEIHFKEKKEIFLDKEKLVGFSPWSDIASVCWKEKHYTPYQLCQLFDKTYDNSCSTKHSKGILFDCGRMYISPGFFLRDITKLETASLPIVHLISYQQVKEQNRDLGALCYKLLETAKYRCSLRFNENYLHDETAIKAHVPVTISAENALTCTIIHQLMQKDGYMRPVTADQADDSANRFLLSLNTEPVENAPFTYSVILDRQLEDSAIPDEMADFKPLSELELEDIADPITLQKRYHQVSKRLQKLNDQLKVLSSSKAEVDKNRYVDMLSRNKMELITSLLEISEIWDEHTCDIAVARQESVLVLYDDEKQAVMIDNQLERSERKTFLNISQHMGDFESLVNFNAGIVEPFLHDGVVVCCITAKAILLRRFQQFKQELSQRDYPPLDKAIINLKSEILKCEDKTRRMKVLNYGSYLRELYLDNAKPLFEAIKNYFKEVEKTRYLVKNKGTIFVIGDDKDNCERIGTAINLNFTESDKITIQTFFSELNLLYGDSEEQDACEKEVTDSNLIDLNVNELSRFYKSIASAIALKDVDMFFLAGETQLNQLLIDFLRQKGSKYINTPIVLLASGAFHYQLMDKISQKGVKVLYQDQFHRDNPEVLAQTFKTMLAFY